MKYLLIILFLIFNANVYSQENYPVYGQFVEVDEMPKYDSLKLKSLIEYPDLARRALISGLVKISILVNTDGLIVKKGVVYSDSKILNNSLMDAINKYGKFKPAIKDNKKIACWLEIPYNFKLTSKDSSNYGNHRDSVDIGYIIGLVKDSIDTLEYLKIPPMQDCNNNKYVYRRIDEDNFEGYELDDDVVEEYPSPLEFIPVEKNPVIDIGKLQGLIEYPDLARRSRVEGRVIVKILVDKNGDIIKKIIEETDSSLLNKSALNSLDRYGKVEPAIQNKRPIHCWLSVPITFKLRPLKENKENE